MRDNKGLQAFPEYSVGLYGNFGFQAYDVNKKRMVLACRKKNQITNAGREALLELLFQDPAGTVPQQNPNYNQIWSLSIGTGTLPPTLADTQLVSPVYTSALNFAGGELVKSVLAPTTYELVISKTIPAGTLADGTEVTEAGIFTRGSADGPGVGTWESITYRRMYARQAHPVITITSALAITYEWRLGITIQGS